MDFGAILLVEFEALRAVLGWHDIDGDFAEGDSVLADYELCPIFRAGGFGLLLDFSLGYVLETVSLHLMFAACLHLMLRLQLWYVFQLDLILTGFLVLGDDWLLLARLFLLLLLRLFVLLLGRLFELLLLCLRSCVFLRLLLGEQQIASSFHC